MALGKSAAWTVAQKLRKHKLLLGWAVFLVMLVFWLYFANQRMVTALVIDQDGLSVAQHERLAQLGHSFDDLSFYGADLSAIADQFGQVSWVQSVQVARQWGRGIVVSVVPRTAIARFGSDHLLDTTGTVYVPADSSELSDKRLVGLYGEQSQSNAVITQTYALNRWFAPLELSVQDMMLTPRQTWLVRFDNGLRLTVDYERAEQKLYTLSQLLKNEQLPVPLDDIAVIDLRYKNGFSLTKKS